MRYLKTFKCFKTKTTMNIKNEVAIVTLTILFFFIANGSVMSQNKRIKKSLVAFWDFNELPGSPRKSKNFKNDISYNLLEANGPIEKLDEGPVANSALRIVDGNWLFIPRDSIGDLDIYGEKAEVTVLTWFKKDSDKIWQAIAGVWDETHKKRQYYLFSNAHSRTFQDEMVRYPASNLIHGHISATGGVSPGERAWISYASSNDAVEVGVWTMIAMTYDGKNIKLYINGELSRNEKTNPFKYEEGIFDGGSDGADFTVGANHVQGKMTNQFIGAISGLSVFDKALSEKDIKWIYCNGIDLD